MPHEFLALPVSGFDDLVKNGAKYLLIPKALSQSHIGIFNFVEKRRYIPVKEDDNFVVFKL